MVPLRRLCGSGTVIPEVAAQLEQRPTTALVGSTSIVFPSQKTISPLFFQGAYARQSVFSMTTAGLSKAAAMCEMLVSGVKTR